MTEARIPSLPACIFWDRHQTIESWRAWIHTYEDLIGLGPWSCPDRHERTWGEFADSVYEIHRLIMSRSPLEPKRKHALGYQIGSFWRLCHERSMLGPG